VRHRPKLLVYLVVVAVGFLLGWGTVEVARALGMGAAMVALGLGGSVHLAEDIRRAKVKRIEKALKDAGFDTLKAAADACGGMDVSDFHRMIHDPSRKCDLWRLEMLGPDFIGFLALRDLDYYGMPRLARTAVAVAQAKEQA
jgi:hypothetical protein